MKTPYIQMIADYLDFVAVWRGRRAQEEPHDLRHRRAVKTLEQLSQFVRAADEADERIQNIGRTTQEGEQLIPGPILANGVARFGFYETGMTDDSLLQRMADLALEDKGESGRDPLRDLPF